MMWNERRGEEKYTQSFVWGNAEGTRPAGSRNCRLGNDIKSYLNGIEWETVWILLIRLTIGSDGRLL
jgi:hypothetical protein